MILFICNHPFPHNSGFAARCKNELDLLRTRDAVTVLCRRDDDHPEEPLHSTYSAPAGSIPIIRFAAHTKAIERTDSSNYTSGLYEVIRNVDLFVSFSVKLVQFLMQHSFQEKVNIYCVNSPLTVPLFTYLLTRFFPVHLQVLEFHDLEPEMARHIKNLPDSSLVMKVEYFLEKFLSRKFQKIIVSSETQRERIIERTGIKPAAIFTFPNTIGAPPKRDTYDTDAIQKKFGINPGDFVLTYSGNLTYDYTISGVIELLSQFSQLQKAIPHVRFLIAGDGAGFDLLKQKIAALQLEKSVTLLGRIPDVNEVLAITDVALIPWDKNEISETILPTKLIEYMGMGSAIIAPNLGEFPRVLTDGQDGVLYSNTNELIQKIIQLEKNRELPRMLGIYAKLTFEKQFDITRRAQEYLTFLDHS